MKKNRKIKRVSPLGVLIRIVGFIIFLYSLYQFNMLESQDQKFYIYIILYIFGFSYIIIRTVRNFFVDNNNYKFRIFASFMAIVTFILLVDGLVSFLLAPQDSIKKDIYSYFLGLMTFSILLVEYSFFVLGQGKTRRVKKNKE